MPLPGHLWWIKDQYGVYWNDEPFSTYVEIYYYRLKAVKYFPEFQFSLVMGQRDPSRPIPMFYAPLGKDKYAEEKEPITRDSTTRASDPTSHSEEDF